MAHNRPDVSDIYPWKALPMADPERIAAIVDLTALVHLTDWVWCRKLGCAHSDTLNPNGYIEDGKQDYCTPEDHRAMYMEADDVPRAEPVPVRSNPVPLTVRRHTEESRAIWRSNLRAALPADLLDEDKDRITDALLNTTIKMGNELRRKRLIDNLMTAAEELEDWNGRGNGRARLDRWSELMADAAEEIRSFM